MLKSLKTKLIFAISFLSIISVILGMSVGTSIFYSKLTSATKQKYQNQCNIYSEKMKTGFVEKWKNIH